MAKNLPSDLKNSDSFVFIPDSNEVPPHSTNQSSASSGNIFNLFQNQNSAQNIFSNMNASNLSSKFISVKNFLITNSSKLKPWLEFFAIHRISKPQGFTDWTTRVYFNLRYFGNNYLFLLIGLAIYCLVTNPLLLIILSAWIVIWWLINYKSKGGEIVCAGQVLGVKEIIAISGIMSLPLLYFAGVGSTFFWLIGVTIVVVGLHSSFITVEIKNEFTMDELNSQV